ncbi:MAG TPA: BON domain-containing protein [Actinomycetota bacterium]|nr:BON domain-containing protein [Actinomycetota bacterium]
MQRLMPDKRVGKVRQRLSEMMPAARKRKARRQKITLFAAGSVAGAALAFLFDPQRGKARRKKAIDRVGGTVRKATRRTARFGRHMASDARGMARRLAARGERRMPETDAVLVTKVESEVLGDPDLPKGSVSINAEDGIIVLRGQVERPEQIRRLEKAVRKVDGVQGVENLLHLPGTPAPSSRGRVSAGRA